MIIYTDGSCKKNPGPGGYGVVVMDDDEQVLKMYSHSEENTTNNIQELKAILYTMINYGVKINENDFISDIPIVYSDSSYCVNTLNSWMFSWANNNWKKADNKIPENLELIKTYYDLYQNGYRIELRKIKGHHGVCGNELADKLAKGLIKV